MSLENKSLDTLTEQDFQDLIENQVTEGKAYDYKVALLGNSDGDKKEFLADVSSFANTVGGHLVFGIDEAAGVATAIPGLPSLNPDNEKLRLEEIIRNGIEPRIAGIDIKEVSCA